MKYITSKSRAIPSLFMVLIVGLMLFRSADAQQQAQMSQETQDLLDALVLKIRVTAAAIHENETLAGNEQGLDYFVHIPSINKLELGLELDISEPDNGLKVLSVSKDSMADSVGIKAGDRIVTVNHFEANDANREVILSELQLLQPGDILTLMVDQGNGLNRLAMTIEENLLPAVNLVVGQHEIQNNMVNVTPEEFQGFDDTSKAFKTSRTSNSRIKSGFDGSLDFSQYRTYNFRSQTAFEKPDFHDLLGLTFSAATEQHLLSRGYIRSDNPDVLINVSADLIDIQRAPNQAGNCPSYADYHSRKPTSYFRYSRIKQARLAESRRTFCAYTEGSITIDVVDVKRMRTIWEAVSKVRIDDKERGFLMNGMIVSDDDESINPDMVDVKRRSTFQYDHSRLSDDEIEKGFLVKGYIMHDVAIMFEGSPFRETSQGTIVTDINKQVSMACWIPVHVYNIDGKNFQTSPSSFKIDQGKHIFKVRVNPGHRNPNCLAPSQHFSAENIQRYRIEPFEIEVEAGKSYHIGFNAEDRIRKNWKVEVWKVE